MKPIHRAARAIGIDLHSEALTGMVEDQTFDPKAFRHVNPNISYDDGSPRFRSWARWLQGPGLADPQPMNRRAWSRAREVTANKGEVNRAPIESLNVGIVLTVTGWGELEIQAARTAWVKLKNSPFSRLVVVQNLQGCWESTQNWCADYPGMLFASVENYGFSHANNRGAAMLVDWDHEWLLFTQADVKWTLDALEQAIAVGTAWGGATVGCAGGKLSRDGHGNVSEYGRNVERAGGGGHQIPGRVDWIAGYWFLCPRRAFDVIGGWCETFFLYSEDPDLSMRLEIAGSPQIVEPSLEVDHQRSTTILASFTQGARTGIQEHSRRRLNQRWGGL